MSIESFIKKVCVQTAVYWGNPVPDGYGGMLFDDPVEIKVRWEDKTKVISTQAGQEVTSRSEVLTPLDLDYEGYLFLGTLDDVNDPNQAWNEMHGIKLNPATVQGAYQIVRVDKTPMVMSTKIFVRKVYLYG